MNKMKKLLSVVLAVVLAFSALSVLGSAAKTAYRTVEELETLDAYSPYGQVTRLSTEERASIVQDYLDTVLPGLGINMGEVFNVLGLSITLDLSNIDQLCYSLDTVKNTMNNFLFGIAAGIVNLGIVEQLEMDTWATGIKRDTASQLTLFAELFELLSNNTTLVNSVLTNGLDLGIIGGLIGGDLDLSSINDIVKDLPTLVKGLVFPMLERWDDTAAEIEALETNGKGDGNVEKTVNTFVQNLFKNDMSITTVKLDSNGNVTSKHNLPGNGADARVRYIKSGNILEAHTYATQKHVDAQAELGNVINVGDYITTATYVLEPEVGTSDYVWAQVNVDEEGNIKMKDDGSYDYVGQNLKYYELDSKLLPSFNANIDLSTMSAAELLYTFVPSVFNDLATVVANGSLKKLLGGLFGVKYTYVGEVGDDAVADLGSEDIFTAPQGDYVFEWSDYLVKGDKHYYRYLDQVFEGDLSNTNNYFDIFNWEYEITGDFMNEFVPANGGSTSDTLFMNLNNFLVKVAETVILPSAETDDSSSGFEATWTRPAFTKGDNSNLVANIKAAAQAFIALAPQHIFGSDYATNDRCYYNLLVSGDNATVLAGIAAQLVDILMPSMTLPGVSALVESKATVGAILAAVVREFAAYLTPEYNYDALIYVDFGTTTADKEKTFVSGKDNNYWLDVILTMGINIGFEYIRAFADMGEDTAEWASFVEYSGYKVDGGAYTEADLKLGDATANYWEGMLDYIVDWALEKDYEWTWKMENLVNTEGLEINLATAQDPWVKLDKILNDLLPADELLSITATDCETELEQALRYNLILGLVDLKWEKLTNMIIVPDGMFRAGNVLDQLATLVKNLLNGLLAKIGGGNYEFIPSAIKDFDSLAVHANIRTLAVNLVGKLYTAYQNGLLDTVLPILNMFIGWKMDPQVIADPIITTSFRDGNDYAYQWTGQTGYPAIDANSTLINFLNNSAGMLEKHANGVNDHEYAIQLGNVTSDASVNTLSFSFSDGNGYVSPYETVSIKIGGTYVGEEAVTITIPYEYIGKDGKAVGGTQYTSITVFFSNQYEDANIEGRKSGDDADGTYGIDPFKSYQFTEDIYTSVTTYQPSVWGTNPTVGGGTSNFHWLVAPAGDDTGIDCDKNMTGNTAPVDMNALAKEYFAYYQNQDGGWGNSFPKDGSTSGKLYYAKNGVTAETEFPYGTYNMGQVAIAYSNDVKFWKIAYIYYNDYDIYDIYTANKDNGYNANMGVDPAIYNEYNEAWKDIVKYATYPMMTEANGNAATDYVATIMPKIPAAIERFEAALEAFNEAKAEADASSAADAALPKMIVDLQNEIENDFMNGKEINFQDYKYYEYFNYSDMKTDAENLYRTYLAPEIMDTYYIMGSGISEAELDKVIAAEGNEFVAAGITASRMHNDQAAIDASIAAHNDWQQPINTKLYVEDVTARLAYYKTFLDASARENDDHLYFLEKEIAHIEAQELVAADYEEVTWGRFADALAEAKKVASGADEYSAFNSRIYDVKYNLMVAYKQLLPLANSLKEAGGTADLEANIEIANAIFASLEAGDGAWALKEGVEANAAYAQLIQALGYYYVGEDGNTWNLYADSALEYADNDRPNKTANQAKVDAANYALVAAIENFEAAEEPEPSEPNTLVLNENAPFEAIIDYTNCGDYTATIYGFDTIGINLDVMPDGTIADFLSTAYGDDYLEVIVPDCGMETTGTVINVLDEEGNVVESYVYVLFGDMDQDGWVSGSDKYVAEMYDMTLEGIETLDVFMAGDVDGDAWVSGSDGYMMELFDTMLEFPTQAEIGEINVNNYYELIV